MITAGVDSGSRYVALVVLEVDPAPTLLHASTLRLESHDDDELDRVAHAVGELAIGVWGASVAVLERADRVFVPQAEGDSLGRLRGRAQSMATALLISDRVGERVRAELLRRGASVRCDPAGTIRARVYGRQIRGAGVDLETWLRGAVAGWEGRERAEGAGPPEHERDACVAALLPSAEARREAERAARVRAPRRRREAPATATADERRELARERARARERELARQRGEHRAVALAALGLETGQHICRRCGGPRRGHLRGLPCPPRP